MKPRPEGFQRYEDMAAPNNSDLSNPNGLQEQDKLIDRKIVNANDLYENGQVNQMELDKRGRVVIDLGNSGDEAVTEDILTVFGAQKQDIMEPADTKLQTSLYKGKIGTSSSETAEEISIQLTTNPKKSGVTEKIISFMGVLKPGMPKGSLIEVIEIDNYPGRTDLTPEQKGNRYSRKVRVTLPDQLAEIEERKKSTPSQSVSSEDFADRYNITTDALTFANQFALAKAEMNKILSEVNNYAVNNKSNDNVNRNTEWKGIIPQFADVLKDVNAAILRNEMTSGGDTKAMLETKRAERTARMAQATNPDARVQFGAPQPLDATGKPKNEPKNEGKEALNADLEKVKGLLQNRNTLKSKIDELQKKIDGLKTKGGEVKTGNEDEVKKLENVKLALEMVQSGTLRVTETNIDLLSGKPVNEETMKDAKYGKVLTAEDLAKMTLGEVSTKILLNAMHLRIDARRGENDPKLTAQAELMTALSDYLLSMTKDPKNRNNKFDLAVLISQVGKSIDQAKGSATPSVVANMQKEMNILKDALKENEAQLRVLIAKILASNDKEAKSALVLMLIENNALDLLMNNPTTPEVEKPADKPVSPEAKKAAQEALKKIELDIDQKVEAKAGKLKRFVKWFSEAATNFLAGSGAKLLITGALATAGVVATGGLGGAVVMGLLGGAASGTLGTLIHYKGFNKDKMHALYTENANPGKFDFFRARIIEAGNNIYGVKDRITAIAEYSKQMAEGKIKPESMTPEQVENMKKIYRDMRILKLTTNYIGLNALGMGDIFTVNGKEASVDDGIRNFIELFEDQVARASEAKKITAEEITAIQNETKDEAQKLVDKAMLNTVVWKTLKGAMLGGIGGAVTHQVQEWWNNTHMPTTGTETGTSHGVLNTELGDKGFYQELANRQTHELTGQLNMTPDQANHFKSAFDTIGMEDGKPGITNASEALKLQQWFQDPSNGMVDANLGPIVHITTAETITSVPTVTGYTPSMESLMPNDLNGDHVVTFAEYARSLSNGSIPSDLAKVWTPAITAVGRGHNFAGANFSIMGTHGDHYYALAHAMDVAHQIAPNMKVDSPEAGVLISHIYGQSIGAGKTGPDVSQALSFFQKMAAEKGGIYSTIATELGGPGVTTTTADGTMTIDLAKKISHLLAMQENLHDEWTLAVAGGAGGTDNLPLDATSPMRPLTDWLSTSWGQMVTVGGLTAVTG
ncbi:MAG TPA: hypothetical protein VHA74_00715, partial [Candidatus Dojkabacteria bacterium]|nr:hypothetical protein [Candidatus Dojkabacteria bacterium]